eukprot:3099672-Prymnesium_polylepis.1
MKLSGRERGAIRHSSRALQHAPRRIGNVHPQPHRTAVELLDADRVVNLNRRALVDRQRAQ